MKKDIPFKTRDVLRLAQDRDFFVHDGVSKGGFTVAALESSGPMLRFFAPEVQVRPWGSEISGTIGLALSSDSSGNHYESTVSQHILNWSALRNSSRLLENRDDVDEFFVLLKEELEALPSTPADVVRWAEQADGWLAKQLSWRREPAIVSFERAKLLVRNHGNNNSGYSGAG